MTNKLKNDIKIKKLINKISNYTEQELCIIIQEFIYNNTFSKSINTIIAYLYDILIGVRYFYKYHQISSSRLLFLISLNTFRSFLSSLRSKGVSVASQQRILCSWKIFFRHYNKDNLANFKSVKSVKRCPKPLSKDIIDIILIMDENNFSSLRNKALWILMYTSGMRISEALSMHTSQIECGVIKIKGKGQRERIIPITDFAQKLINKYNSMRKIMQIDLSILFTDEKGNLISQQAASHAFRRWKIKESINNNCTLHSLRHAFATHILKNGCPLTVIQKTLGHKNLSTTTQYLQIENHYLEEQFMKHVK